MARSNPDKQKKRSAKETFLLCGEGDREVLFLRHLKKNYSNENNLAVKIVNGNGGSIPNMVSYALRIIGYYSRRIVICDSDRPIEELKEARELADDRGVILIENIPCIEALFLSILGKKCSGLNTNQCKKKFETEFLKDSKNDNSKQYEKIFPKKMLSIKRRQIENLDKIISIIENVVS